jgi:hypothetical protein
MPCSVSTYTPPERRDLDKLSTMWAARFHVQSRPLARSPAASSWSWQNSTRFHQTSHYADVGKNSPASSTRLPLLRSAVTKRSPGSWRSPGAPVLKCVGTQELMMQATHCTRPEGSVGYAGVCHKPSWSHRSLFGPHAHRALCCRSSPSLPLTKHRGPMWPVERHARSGLSLPSAAPTKAAGFRGRYSPVHSTMKPKRRSSSGPPCGHPSPSFSVAPGPLHPSVQAVTPFAGHLPFFLSGFVGSCGVIIVGMFGM